MHEKYVVTHSDEWLYICGDGPEKETLIRILLQNSELPLAMIESFSMGIITIKENFSKEKNMELFRKIYESGKVF